MLKLPPVRNCFSLSMANKLVVIINSLKVPKIKKILLHNMVSVRDIVLGLFNLKLLDTWYIYL